MTCLFIRSGRYPPMPKCELARRGRLHIPEEDEEYTGSDDDSGKRKRSIGTSECDRVGELYFVAFKTGRQMLWHPSYSYFCVCFYAANFARTAQRCKYQNSANFVVDIKMLRILLPFFCNLQS